MKRVLPILMTPVVASLLAGCATVTSQDNAKGAAEGVAYFLPRQMVKITAARSGGKLDDAIKALAEAQTAHDAAKAKVAATTAAIRATEDMLIDAGSPEAKEILKARLKALNEDLGKQTAAVGEAKKAVDEARLKVLAAAGQAANPPGPGAYKVQMKLDLLPPSADPAQAFVLNPRHTPLRDDEHKLVISPAGLLTSTDITSIDRTGEILVELAAFAGGRAGNAPVGMSGRDCTGAPSEFTGLVDLASAASLAEANQQLECLGVRLVVNDVHWAAVKLAAPGDRRGTYGNAIEGIAYRTPVEVEVRIERCTDKDKACTATTGWHPTETIAFPLPQAGPISYVRQDAGLLVKTKYALAFKDGILVNYDASRPSELLEVARTPMRVVQGGFDGLSKVVSLRTGVTNNRKDLLAAQKGLLDAQYAIKKASLTGDKGLADAELELLKAQVALEAGQIDGQKTITAAELELLKQKVAVLQQQYALDRATITGQKDALSEEQTLLTAQTTLATARNNAAALLAANQLANDQALLLTQAKRDAMNRCVNEKLQAGEAINGCLTP